MYQTIRAICRFCGAALPDWTEALEPHLNVNVPAPPAMAAIVLGGQVHLVAVGAWRLDVAFG